MFLHLNDFNAFEKVLPSKIFEYGATEKPILAGVSGYAKKFIDSEIINCATFNPCDSVQAFNALSSLKLEIVDQIVMVDDCSTDNSYLKAEKIFKDNNKILLTKTKSNKGKGAAVKKGLSLISTSHVIIHDADLEYFPDDIPEMTRTTHELYLYDKYGIIDVLKVCVYIVDTLRKHNIIWGVGRGSSVSSYVLYLIGIHKVDSIKYELDINEFLK